MKTRTGLELGVRTVRSGDGMELREFFAHVTREDLRFRYFVGIERVGDSRIADLTNVDHRHVENYLAYGAVDKSLLAVATLACDADFDHAEVAITVRDDHKGQGIGWELLSYVATAALEKGVKVLESVEQRDNHDALELERHMGFELVPDHDDPTIVIVRKNLG